MSLDVRFENLKNRKRLLESDLERAVAELLNHLRASRDKQNRLVAIFDETAEPVCDKIEKLEGEIALVRGDIDAIRSALGDFDSIGALWIEIRRLQTRIESAKRNLLIAREKAVRRGVEPENLLDDARVREAEAAVERAETDPALIDLRERFERIKAALGKLEKGEGAEETALGR